MRQYMLATVEQRKDVSGEMYTHPMEVAWAKEAIFFLTVEKVKNSGSHLEAIVQISPDGINWINEGTEFKSIHSEGLYFQKVVNFGGWLRLKMNIRDKGHLNLTIHLSLKE